MKYPSECLYDLANTLDRLEDEVTRRLEGVTADFWNWPRYKRDAESLEAQKEELLRAYGELADLYAKETGKVPPVPPHLAAEFAIRSLRQYANQALVRWRP